MFQMDVSKVLKAVKISQGPSEFFKVADQLGVMAAYRDSHTPITEFCNDLKYAFPELLGYVRCVVEDRLFSIVLEKEPRRGRRPISDELTALRDIGNYEVAIHLKEYEAAIVEHICGVWDDAAETVHVTCSRNVGRTEKRMQLKSARSIFVYKQVEVLATILAYRPMHDFERIATVSNMARLSRDFRSNTSEMRVLPVHASLMGASNDETTHQRLPAQLWGERMGKVAAMVEYFYFSFLYNDPEKDPVEALVEDTYPAVMDYWKHLCQDTELFSNGNHALRACYWYNKETGKIGGIDWSVYKDRRTGFGADFETIAKSVTRYNRTLEKSPETLTTGDLYSSWSN